MRKLFIALIFASMISGCATVFETLDRFRPIGTTVLNTAQTLYAIADIRDAYVSARQEARLNRDIFSDAEWEILTDANRVIVDLAQKLDKMKEGDEIILTTSELVSLILPARDAAISIMTVVDAHFEELNDDAQRAYMTLMENYGRIEGEFQSILAEGNNRARADLLVEVLDLIAKLYGVAKIGLI